MQCHNHPWERAGAVAKSAAVGKWAGDAHREQESQTGPRTTARALSRSTVTGPEEGGRGMGAPGESWVTLIFPGKYRLRYPTSSQERTSSGFLKHKPPWGNQSLHLEQRTHLIYTILEIKPLQHAQQAISTKAELRLEQPERARPGC